MYIYRGTVGSQQPVQQPGRGLTNCSRPLQQIDDPIKSPSPFIVLQKNPIIRLSALVKAALFILLYSHKAIVLSDLFLCLPI